MDLTTAGLCVLFGFIAGIGLICIILIIVSDTHKEIEQAYDPAEPLFERKYKTIKNDSKISEHLSRLFPDDPRR